MTSPAPRRVRSLSTRHGGACLLLRAVPYQESDVIATLFSEQHGKLTATAHGARNPKRSQNLILEPMHTLAFTADLSAASERYTLRTCKLEHLRTRLTSRLDGLDAAGRGLRWVRVATPALAPEPRVWAEITSFLDRLDAPGVVAAPRELARLGLRLLDALGYALDLERCVRCGKPCESGRAAYLDPEAGGLVCRACGGGPVQLEGSARSAMLRIVAGDDTALSELPEPDDVAAWVDSALRAHANVEIP
ncbi:MAG: DNA repair protein RecO [Polyangiaceae bacterium]